MALLRSHAFVYRKPLSRSTILTNLLQTFIGCNVHYPIYLSIETFFVLHKNMQPLNYFIYWCCSSVKTIARDNVKYKLYSKPTYIRTSFSWQNILIFVEYGLAHFWHCLIIFWYNYTMSIIYKYQKTNLSLKTIHSLL